MVATRARRIKMRSLFAKVSIGEILEAVSEKIRRVNINCISQREGIVEEIKILILD